MNLSYLSGFGNQHASEALEGALPQGRNSPRRAPYGLYAEKFSGTAFTAPRCDNRRTWMYRIAPSVMHSRFSTYSQDQWVTWPNPSARALPEQMRWGPMVDVIEDSHQKRDFVDGMFSIAGNGAAHMQAGIATHMYRAERDMTDRCFYNADAEMLIVPQTGGLHIRTECGVLTVGPGDIALIPRGMKFQVNLLEPLACGYVAENYGKALELPERGPVGTDGFANERDFEAPTAAFEDSTQRMEMLCKFSGRFYRAELARSPFDVVAWHGNNVPYRYDLRRFNTIGSISYDHPDPSIFTVLTSQSDTAGVANLDFVIFPPRWLVMEDTFRPPWYHRNIMSEFMGLIYGEYDAKPGNAFAPGGCSLHNCMSAHGPDRAAFEKGSAESDDPVFLPDTMAFMFESRYPFEVTEDALNSPQRQTSYTDCWADLPIAFNPDQR